MGRVSVMWGRVKARQAEDSSLTQPTGQAERCGIRMGVTPKDTLAQNRKSKRGEEDLKNKWRIKEASQNLFIQLSGHLTKRGQSFPLLPVSAGDFLAWTRTSHLICSLTTTTTTVLSPRLQFLGSSQKNKAVNKDWARQEGSLVDFLSGLLTVHQLTGQGVILLSSSSEFLYIYGFFPHTWNIFRLFYFLF